MFVPSTSPDVWELTVNGLRLRSDGNYSETVYSVLRDKERLVWQIFFNSKFCLMELVHVELSMFSAFIIYRKRSGCRVNSLTYILRCVVVTLKKVWFLILLLWFQLRFNIGLFCGFQLKVG